MINTRKRSVFTGLIPLNYMRSINNYQTNESGQINATTAHDTSFNKTGKERQHVSANAMVMPIVVILAILHVLVVALIIAINTSSSTLSSTMVNAGRYTQDATSLLAGSSLLSETSSNFILMPRTETGEINVQPLAAYAQELAQENHRGNQVLARFKDYDVSMEVYHLLSEAADNANFMLDAQLHAISLMRSIYQLPNIPQLNQIPTVELTEEEMNMPDHEKEASARRLVLGSVYGLNKQSISQNVNAAVGIIQGTSSAKAAEASIKIERLRTSMWVVTVSIIVILVITFTMLYTKILNPLKKFTEQIPAGEYLDEDKGFQEINMLASAYNGVLKRRNSLDTILRNAAETDALTNLPNRYSFEQYMLESAENKTSMAVFLFDVNYLKKTNDTLGHLAGDKLICTAAKCISACFGDKCFRFGGDEFAAIVENCTPESINQMVTDFQQSEMNHKVSVSFGYAYTDEIGSTTVKSLLDEADRNMYIQKREMHSQESVSD